MKRLLCMIGALALLTGCATFEVEGVRPDGTTVWRVREMGAPLLTRSGNFEVSHRWLDEGTNTLHECSIRRDTDENAQPQVEAVRILSEALAGRPLSVAAK